MRISSADVLEGRWPSTRFERPGAALAREAMLAVDRGAELVVTVVEPDFAAARLWVNEASLQTGTPSLSISVHGSRAELGPLVLPGEGPCYLCWRMRALACADDFASTMAREEAYDAARTQSGVPRPVLPTLVPWVVGVVGREAIAATLGLAAPRLAAHVLVMDGLGLTEQLHPGLPRPDCPACSKKGRPPRAAPACDELVGSAAQTTNFDDIARVAVTRSAA